MYNWHSMSVTIHQILVHGARIIELTTLPVGFLSEQGAEARNKYWRFDREHYARKTSHKDAMFDLFHRALVSSDPVISEYGLKKRKSNLKKDPLAHEAIKLLKDRFFCSD
jgi:hypothetical protein